MLISKKALLLFGMAAPVATLWSQSTNSNATSNGIILPPVTVVAQAEQTGVIEGTDFQNPGGFGPIDSKAATRTFTPNMDNPVSVQVIPREVLKSQQTIYLDDALQNVAGVIPENDSFGTGDSFSIRGFDMNNLIFEDGLRSDYSSVGFQRSMQNVENIEVVKGPASVLYGQAEPGGLVNIDTKKPLNSNYVAIDQQIGSFAFYRTTLDASGPLNDDKTLLYRFNVDQQNNWSYRDGINAERLFLFPTIQWKPNSDNQATLEVTYAHINQVIDNGIPFMTNGTPANVSPQNNYVLPGANQNPTQDFAVKLSATHKFNDDLMLHAAYKTEFINSPQPNGQFYTSSVDQAGDFSLYSGSIPVWTEWTQEFLSDLTATFETWFVKHTGLIGFDYYHQSYHYEAQYNDNYGSFSMNIYAPNYSQSLPPIDPALTKNQFQYMDDCGAFLQDQMELPGHIHLLAGFRYDNLTTASTYYGSSASTINDRPPLTPRFGVLWQPVKQASLYGSYTENYGITALGAQTQNGQPLPPESAQQWEAGIKGEFLDKKLTTTLAFYQITKQNIPTADPSNPAFETAIGQARSRGLELEATGEILPGWKIIGGYSYISSVITQDNGTSFDGYPSPSMQGLRLPGVPYNSGSLWSTYEIQEGPFKRLKVGAGVVARSQEQAYDSTVPPYSGYVVDSIPAFAVLNAMASYPFRVGSTKWTAQVNLNNIFNTAYFSTVNPYQAMPAAPFNFMASLKVEF